MKIFIHQSHLFIQLIILLLVLLLHVTATTTAASSGGTTSLVKDSGGVNEPHRRKLHQPLYPESPPPTEEQTPSPPSPDSDEGHPFFPEGSAPTALPPPTVSSSTSSGNGSFSYPTATQPNKPAKRVAIAISVGIVTLGMLSALAFFLYRYRARHSGETTRKLVGGNSERVLEESRMPPQSSFLYIGTVEPSSPSGSRMAVIEAGGENEANGSPYHRLKSAKISDRYRPSPELQPLPPLSRELNAAPTATATSSAAISSSDEENQRAFYTLGSLLMQGSTVRLIEPNPSVLGVSLGLGPVQFRIPFSYSDRASSLHHLSRASSEDSSQNVAGYSRSSVPRSKRTSPRARLSSSLPDIVKTVIPSINQSPTTPPPTPPPRPPPENARVELSQGVPGYIPQRPKLSLPPPPPNRMLLQSISKQSPRNIKHTLPPSAPPPPPPPPLPLQTPRKDVNSETRNNSFPPAQSVQSHNPKEYSWAKASKPVIKQEDTTTTTANGSGSLERLDSDETERGRPKLKALHWDKVRAVSERATVWDQLKSSSFHLNEDMMETLFGCNSTNPTPKESTKKTLLPPVEHENRILDPKKSQNIAILLRALNVTRDEVSEALLDGNPEGLGAELLETLVKMAPTKEEEIKVREYSGDVSALGSAERFLKTILDVPFAFKRVEAMLYRANFDTELTYLRKSFQALEDASEELKNSGLFLKLLEAVLKTGNHMNVGTNRGDARAFKLDTLLKLVDIKGTDGKTTLLHFVVQEIIRSEGLQAVSGLSRDLSNVKKAAGMDSDVLSSYVSKLETGLDKVGLVLQHEKPNTQSKFFESMKKFLREAEKEIQQIKLDEKKALSLVKDATGYFHGDTTKEEAHPLRLFMIVRDFLAVLDNACKEVGRIQDRTIVGSARSFRISSSASLPVLNRYNVRQDSSSDEESP